MDVGLLFAALLLLRPGAVVGLRAKPDGEWAALEEDSPTGLPKLARFNASWRELALQELAELARVPGVQLLLGVFTTAREKDFRSIIRETWMKRTGVCKAGQGPDASCSVYVAFVQGAPAVPDGQSDQMMLPIDENMNNGKSFEFFRLAVQACPWATHYGKMDSDVFPHLSLILQSMHTRPGCEGYFGKPWTCREDNCPSPACGPPVDGDFLRYHVTGATGHCWSYMQGGLYILSRGLALEAVEGSRYWEYHFTGFEDVTTGRALAEVAWTKGLCVDTWTSRPLLDGLFFHFMTEPRPARISAAWDDFYAPTS